VCVVVDLAHKFGLTAEQFGENLRDQYQRHDVEQDRAEPLDLAEQFIAGYVSLSVCLSLSLCVSVSVSVCVSVSVSVCVLVSVCGLLFDCQLCYSTG